MGSGLEISFQRAGLLRENTLKYLPGITQQMTVLVTGATGFLGAELRLRNYQIRGTARPDPPVNPQPPKEKGLHLIADKPVRLLPVPVPVLQSAAWFLGRKDIAWRWYVRQR